MFTRQEAGDFISVRKQDVLSAALNTPEHPGRVRCKGAFATQTAVFGAPARSSVNFFRETQNMKDAYELQIARLRRQLEERDSAYDQRFKELEARLDNPPDFPSQDYTSPSNNVPTNLSGNTEVQPPPLNHPCKLLTEVGGKVVAVGYLLNTGGSVVHGTPLDQHHSRVSITEAVIPDALLPVPAGNGEFVLVGDAIGVPVAWPKVLILDESIQVINYLHFSINLIYLISTHKCYCF